VSARVPAGAIDWDAAVRTGQRLVPSGPDASPAEAADVVTQLREFAVTGELAAREVTGLGADLPLEPAEVVERRAWVAATADQMRLLTAPVADRLAVGIDSPRMSRALARPIGSVLAVLSGRVLGQYDPFAQRSTERVTSEVGPPSGAAVNAGGSRGRLLLVAPNVLKVERELNVDPRDFRLWVCLHEGTHRLQFRAVPWMVDHFADLVRHELEVAVPLPDGVAAPDDDADGGPADGADDDAPDGRGRRSRSAVDPAALRSALSDSTGELVHLLRGRRKDGPEAWLRRMRTPEHQEVFDQLMALMALLEGHADHVMDAAGPSVVPSVARIRTAFQARRERSRGLLDRLLQQLLGLDQKLLQYAKGAEFVGAVVDRVGMTEFNAVWAAPDHLPTASEITDPAAWIHRVLG
jgi:uncharacterized protein (DUF2342 family)